VSRQRAIFRSLAALTFLLWLGGSVCGDAGTPIPPAPERWLTDSAGFLSPAVRSEIDARLEQFENSSGHQFVVYIGSSTGGVAIEEWAERAFQEWRVGRQKLDDGLALFIMSEDKSLRIEVGYGLEDKIPDITAGRVIHDVIVPRMQQGDPDGAVTAGVEALIGIFGGGEATGPAAPKKPLTWFQKILIGIAVLFFLFLLITNPSLAFYLLFNILSGGRGGGGGGGGFFGGGGRSGGGGASGRW